MRLYACEIQTDFDVDFQQGSLAKKHFIINEVIWVIFIGNDSLFHWAAHAENRGRGTFV